MDKYGRQAGDNWFDYRRYIHLHESVLNRFSGSFVEDVYYLQSEEGAELQLDAKVSLVNGLNISIQKWAIVRTNQGQLECQTARYKYLAIDFETKYQLRYDSPHLKTSEGESGNWDTLHHRHEISFKDLVSDEFVIIYIPFNELPRGKVLNKTYATGKGKRFSYRKDPWPQVEDFFKEIEAYSRGDY